MTHLRQIHVLPTLVAQHAPALHLDPAPVVDALLAAHAHARAREETARGNRRFLPSEKRATHACLTGPALLLGRGSVGANFADDRLRFVLDDATSSSSSTGWHDDGEKERLGGTWAV